MPTGYTAFIEDGNIESGKDFLLKCARAFGACMELREESLSIDIPTELKPNTYHKEQLDRAYEELEKYKSMSLDDAQKIIDKEYDEYQSSIQDAMLKNRYIQDRYIKIKKEINEWMPPTVEHENLKEFALDQINISVDDNSEKYYYDELSKPKKDAQTYINNKILGALENIKYHTKNWNEEIKSTESNNKWINDLRNSLN